MRERLKGQVIAIDFDGTIAQWAAFPQIGEPVPLALETIREFIANEVKVVLSTVRCSEALKMACDWLAEKGIDLHGVNVRPGQSTYSLSPKIDAELFIDDKAFGCPLVYPHVGRPYVDWKAVRNELDME